MHHHSRWFVDDGEKLVFINNIERNILRLKSRDRCLDQVDLDLVALANLVRRLDGLVVDENILVIDQPL